MWVYKPLIASISSHSDTREHLVHGYFRPLFVWIIIERKEHAKSRRKIFSSSFSPFALLNDISKALPVIEHISVMRVESLVSSGEDVGRPSLWKLPFNSSMLEFDSTSTCSPLLLCLSISSMMMCIEAANLWQLPLIMNRLVREIFLWSWTVAIESEQEHLFYSLLDLKRQ